MDRIEHESLWLFCPCFADGFVAREALEGLQSAGKIISADEVGQVSAQSVVRRRVEALDGSVLDGAVHALDLPVGPRMSRLGEAMVDAVLGAGILERVCPDRRAAVEREPDIVCRRAGVSWRGEVGTVVGQDDVDAIRHGLDQRPQEVSGDPARGLLVQFDEGKLCGAIDGNQEVELALFSSDLGDVHVEVAERVGFEGTFIGLVAGDIRQTRDAVALQAAVQRCSGAAVQRCSGAATTG